MKALLRYLSILKLKLANSFAQLASFRTSLVLTVAVDLFHAATYLLTIDFLYAHLTKIGPWNRSEFMFFVCFLLTVDFMHSSLAAPNFWNFSDELRSGKLDFRLLKPVGSLFEVLTAVIRPTSLAVAILPFSLLIWHGMKLNFDLTAWALLVPLLAMAFTLTMIVETFIVLALFWTVAGDGVQFLRMQTQKIRRAGRIIFISPLPAASSVTFFPF